MAIKDWPLPVRIALAWTLLVLAFAIAFLPVILIVLAARTTMGEALSWIGLLGGYALLITIPTTFVVALSVALRLQQKRRSTFGFAVLMGTVVGIATGLALSLMTGGYSLLSSPRRRPANICRRLVRSAREG